MVDSSSKIVHYNISNFQSLFSIPCSMFALKTKGLKDRAAYLKYVQFQDEASVAAMGDPSKRVYMQVKYIYYATFLIISMNTIRSPGGAHGVCVCDRVFMMVLGCIRERKIEDKNRLRQ